LESPVWVPSLTDESMDAKSLPRESRRGFTVAPDATSGPRTRPEASPLGSAHVPDESAHRREWETIASLDPFWAVLSESDRKHGRWDRDEFFATGRVEVTARLSVAAKLGLPRTHLRALDFGCGLGRTTRALAEHFDSCVGLDISSTMLNQARELNEDVSNLDWIQADGSKPLPFEDEAFDLVYSSIALQHLPGTPAVVAALGEAARILRPGGLLCFQLPSALGLGRLQPRRTAYRALHALRIPETVLYDRLGLHPIRMLSMRRARVESILEQSGLRIRNADESRDPTWKFSSVVYYASAA
jgi:SAM-dependent methyltransferase